MFSGSLSICNCVFGSLCVCVWGFGFCWFVSWNVNWILAGCWGFGNLFFGMFWGFFGIVRVCLKASSLFVCSFFLMHGIFVLEQRIKEQC